MYWVSKNNHVGHNDGDTSVNMMWWDSYPYSSHSFVSRRDWRLFLIILLCQLFMQQTEHKILKLYGVTMSFLHFTGVLLLNSVLTVRQHQANSHAKKGWEHEIQALGMERLKTELQKKGLKCSGTLQERAARLFLLKTTPVEKLPKKLLAKK
ncbi:hypothetical protein POM88_039748 [Heracleum sosnowskyi]|uniref:SDE2/SF3A3 SAP domain-containing protein n=1 Tax=Heracleum sosnowskyi TaxID=360622 RepID=A0AAD8M951_9APIA|nr:hypothetical protein POM88_039748 [Heracleum sosnowskyi]